MLSVTMFISPQHPHYPTAQCVWPENGRLQQPTISGRHRRVSRFETLAANGRPSNGA